MSQPADFNFRAYVRALRRQLWLIIVVTVICGAAGGAYAALKKPQYSATASLAVTDPSQSLAAGGSLISTETPLQLASAAAPQVTSSAVVAAVQKRIFPGARGQSAAVQTARGTSIAALRDRVAVSIDPNSYLVDIVATGRTADAAERLANAFAAVDTALTNVASRRGYAAQATAVRRQLKRMNPASTQAITSASTLARLENLASVAAPLSVSVSATGATGPSTIKRAGTTLAAAIFGLLLGISLATARDAFDRRLRSPEEIAAALDHPIVGSIRHQAMGRGGATTRPGKKLAGPLEDSDLEAFRILRQNLDFLAHDQTARIVIVTSAVSDEGKSTVAAGLAAAAAEGGRRTLLVECDLRRPVIAERHGFAPTPGLTEFLSGHASPQDVLRTVGANGVEQNGHGAVPGRTLVCVPAGATVPRPAELLISAKFNAFLAEVASAYELVILDTPPLLPVADTLELIPHASAILLCVRAQHTTREQAAAAQDALDRLPQKPIGLVLTDLSEKEDGRYGGYYRYEPVR